MSTRLYLRNTFSPNPTNWYNFSTVAGTSNDTGVVNTTAGGSQIQWTKTAGGATMNFVSQYLNQNYGLFDLGVTANLWAFESANQANCGISLELWSLHPDNSETQMAAVNSGDGELGTSAAVHNWSFNSSSNPNTGAVGDRIHLKVFIYPTGTMGGGRTCTLQFNNSGNYDSWIEFAETLVLVDNRASVAATLKPPQ